MLGRAYRYLLFGAKERAQLAALVDATVLSKPFAERVDVFHVPSVSSELMEDSLRQANLHVLCVMCKEILPARLLPIPRRCVIGQHPGTMPHYRGSWSSFWALANNEPEMIGTSIFLMEEKVDAGAIIYKDRIDIDYSWDTFYSLTVKSQIRSAVLMARALDDLRQDRLASKLVKSDRKTTYYPVPGLTDFFTYRKALRLSTLATNT